MFNDYDRDRRAEVDLEERTARQGRVQQFDAPSRKEEETGARVHGEKELHARDLQGNEIISYEDGRKIGRVDDMLLDPQTLEMIAVVTSKGGLISRDTSVIPVGEVRVWGWDTLIVSRTEVLRDRKDLPHFDNLLSAFDHLRGRVVVSMDGEKLGQVEDLVINPQNGQITFMELGQSMLEGQNREPRRLPVKAAHSLGKDVLIVDLSRGQA